MENIEHLTGQAKQEIIKEHYRAMQKKSAEKRKQNDPDTYKRMAKLRWESKDDLKIVTE